MSIADFALIIGIADKIDPQIGVDFFVTIAPSIRHNKIKIVGRTGSGIHWKKLRIFPIGMGKTPRNKKSR